MKASAHLGPGREGASPEIVSDGNHPSDSRHRANPLQLPK